jgi:pimeloyl-ACP methyl ester carboxylesterase
LCVGIDKPRTNFADEGANIHSKMVAEANKGQRVCVIAHSAGGVPAAEAVNKFLSTNSDKNSLLQLVFVASFMNRDRVRKIGSDDGWLEVDVNTMTTTALNPEERFYNDMSAEESRPFVEALQPALLWLDHVGTTSDDWKSVRKSYIRCQQDRAVSAELQDKEIEENGFERVEMDVGHCPFVSQPEKFVAALDGILRSWA